MMSNILVFPFLHFFGKIWKVRVVWIFLDGLDHFGKFELFELLKLNSPSGKFEYFELVNWLA